MHPHSLQDERRMTSITNPTILERAEGFVKLQGTRQWCPSSLKQVKEVFHA